MLLAQQLAIPFHICGFSFFPQLTVVAVRRGKNVYLLDVIFTCIRCSYKINSS